MADRVDSSAYAYDIDSSLERLTNLACDESPHHISQDSRGRGPPPIETFLRHTRYTRAVGLRLRFILQDGHDLEPWSLSRTIPDT